MSMHRCVLVVLALLAVGLMSMQEGKASTQCFNNVNQHTYSLADCAFSCAQTATTCSPCLGWAPGCGGTWECIEKENLFGAFADLCGVAVSGFYCNGVEKTFNRIRSNVDSCGFEIDPTDTCPLDGHLRRWRCISNCVCSDGAWVGGDCIGFEVTTSGVGTC